MDKIRILIADDHAAVRAGLAALIQTEPGMELVGEAEDSEEAVARAQSLSPDVVLLDLVMPRQDGMEALAGIKRHNPSVRILVLTDYAETEKIAAAFGAGAMGYLLKVSAPEALLQAIRQVYHGEFAGMLRSMGNIRANPLSPDQI
jgi:NarL family two-component system response regulator LiaR